MVLQKNKYALLESGCDIASIDVNFFLCIIILVDYTCNMDNDTLDIWTAVVGRSIEW